jgi:predicted AlkP superfamily pyrophosphatase or phosphodiesterase
MTKPEEVQDAMWWGGEPIWVTAERQGRLTAAMFWVGSEAPIHGVLPTYWKAYDQQFPPTRRVDQVLQWLDMPPASRPSLVMLYFSDVDSAGHDDGPDSRAVRDAVTRADGYLGRLLRGLERRRLTERVNVVVVSDHGMAAVDSSRLIALDDYVSLNGLDIVDLNPTIGIFTPPGREDEVFNVLNGAHPRLSVYRRTATPEAWHYRTHPRIPTIVGVADEGWQVLRRNTIAGILAQRIQEAGGQHGYDPQVLSMRGIFVAAGPSFKRGVRVPAFENVHIYNALATALGVAPAPNDGDPAIARSLMR